MCVNVSVYVCVGQLDNIHKVSLFMMRKLLVILFGVVFFPPGKWFVMHWMYLLKYIFLCIQESIS